jgi:hypothetical protein
MPLLTSIPVKSSNTSAAFSNDGIQPTNRTSSSCACGVGFPGNKADSSSREKIPCPHCGQTPYSRTHSTRTHLPRSCFFPIRRSTRHCRIREHLCSQSCQLLIYFGLDLPKGRLRMLLPPLFYLFHHFPTLLPFPESSNYTLDKQVLVFVYRFCYDSFRWVDVARPGWLRFNSMFTVRTTT